MNNLTTANIFNLTSLYKEVFGKNPFFIDNLGNTTQNTGHVQYSGIPQNPNPRGTIHKSNITGQSFNKMSAYGKDIWFPITLSTFFRLNTITGNQVEDITIEKNNSKVENITVEIDICTTAVNLIKTVVKTPIVERKGSVIEICDIENPRFTIRGFLIGKNRTVPEEGINNLTKIFESSQPVFLHGGYVELFLAKSTKVIITDLEFPEVQGQSHWIRPFRLVCEADFIEDLEAPPGK